MLKKLLVCLLLFNGLLSAQDIVSTAEGLSNRWSTCIVQDAQGLMWIGTVNGLNRYDGYQVKQVFTPEISDNNISCLLRDKNDIIWIGTANGLNALDTKTGKFRKILLPGKTLSVKSICERANGEIWIGGYEGVVYKVAGNDSLVKIVELQPVTYEGNRLESHIEMMRTDGDRLWILSEWGSIYLFDGKTLSPRKGSADNEYYPITIHPVAPDILLVGSLYSGLYYYEHSTGKVYTDKLLDSINRHSDEVNAYFAEADNSLWFGFNLPVPHLFHLGTGKNREDTYTYNLPPEFTQTRCHYLYQGGEGLLWICTDAGVRKVKPSKGIFKNYFYDQKKSYSFRALIQDTKGDYYMSTYRGLLVCDSSLNLRYAVLHPKGIMRKGPFLRQMIDNGDQVWCASEDGGLMLFNKITRTFRFAPVKSKPETMPLRDYFSLLRQGNVIWVGTESGIFSYDTRTQAFTPVMEKQFKSTAIYQMISLPGNQVLIASSQGLYLVNDGEIKQHYNASTLPSNEVNCIAQGNDKRIYAGTTNGLCRIDLATRKVEMFKVENGLSNNYINFLQKTADGAIWASTNYGISRFDVGSGTFTNYYQKNGLGETEFNRWSGAMDRNGQVLFGTVNGLAVFDPMSYSLPDASAPQLFVSSFSRHDSRQEKQFFTDHFIPGEVLSLSVKDNFIAFDLGLTSYDDARNSRYYYRLAGLQEEWIPLGNQRSVRLNSLPAGNYSLELKGVNSEGKEASNIITIPLEVSNVFYKTGWFALLCALAGIALAYGIYRYRIRQFLKLQAMRTRIASDLHDEVGGMLTRISIQSELLTQEKSLNEKQTEKVSRIAGNSREAIDMMSDVLWSIDGRSDSLAKMIDRMHEHLSTLDEKGISYQVELDMADKDMQIAGDKRQHVYLVFKEAITNIVKHSNASQVQIRLSIRGKNLTLAVKDNGTFSGQNTHTGQGLRNMKMRSEKIKGTLTVDKTAGYSVTLQCVL